MADYLLVHGAFHGAWCWERLIPHLRQGKGVGQVVAIDLAGHGHRFKEREHSQITVEDYLQDVARAVLDGDMRDVVLVGHSFAGAFIPEAATRLKDRIKRVVFLAAMVPIEGKSGRETGRAVGAPGMRPGVKAEEHYREWFCSDMDEATAQWVLKNMTPTPAAGMDRPVSYKSYPRSIPLTYIVFTNDQSMPAAMQRQLANNAGRAEVLELDSGRDGMVSRPKELAQLLLRYA